MKIVEVVGLIGGLHVEEPPDFNGFLHALIVELRQGLGGVHVVNSDKIGLHEDVNLNIHDDGAERFACLGSEHEIVPCVPRLQEIVCENQVHDGVCY